MKKIYFLMFLLLFVCIQFSSGKIPLYCYFETTSIENLCFDNNNSITGNFSSGHDDLSSIDIYLIMIQNQTETIVLDIFNSDSEHIRTSSLTNNQVVSHSFNSFNFESILDSNNHTYFFELSSDVKHDSGVCLGISEFDGITQLWNNYKPVNASPRISLWFDRGVTLNIIYGNTILRTIFKLLKENIFLLLFLSISFIFSVKINKYYKNLSLLSYSLLTYFFILFMLDRFSLIILNSQQIIMAFIICNVLLLFKVLADSESFPKQRKRFYEKLNKIEIMPILIFIFFFLFGLLLRILWLNHYGFLGDELISVLAAEGVIKHGLPIYESGLLYTRGMLFSYILAFFIYLFGNSEIIVKLPSVLFGCFSIVAVFLISKRWFNIKVALLASALLSLSSWAITWSREARMYSLFVLLSIINFYIFYEGFINNNNRYKWAYAFVALLFLFTHSLAIFMIMSCFLYYAIININDLKKIWSDKNQLIFAGLLIFNFILVFLLLKPIILQDSSSVLFGLAKIHMPFLNLFNNISMFILILFIISIPIGIMVRDKKLNYINFTTISTFVLFTFLIFKKGDRYIINLLPLILISSAVAFWVLYSRLSEKYNIIKSPWIKYGLILLLVSSSFFGNQIISKDLKSSFIEKATIIRTADYAMINNYVKDHYHQGDIIISNSPSATYYYFKKPDYYIMDLGYKLYGEELTDKQIGTPWLDFQGLVKLINNENKVWLILDHRYPGRFTCETVFYIEQNCDLKLDYEQGQSSVFLC